MIVNRFYKNLCSSVFRSVWFRVRTVFRSVLFSVNKERGIALFIAVVIVSLTLAAVLGIATIFIRELQLARDIQHSTTAIMAADAGVETALYDQWVAPLPVCGGAVVCPTPALEFSASDNPGDTLRYIVEIATSNTLDADGSFTDANLVAPPWDQSASCASPPWSTCPNYIQGATARFTAPSLLSCPGANITRYWHARAKDSADNLGAWSPIGSFTVSCTAC